MQETILMIEIEVFRLDWLEWVEAIVILGEDWVWLPVEVFFKEFAYHL